MVSIVLFEDLHKLITRPAPSFAIVPRWRGMENPVLVRSLCRPCRMMVFPYCFFLLFKT
jgi:hypothetical protein